MQRLQVVRLHGAEIEDGLVPVADAAPRWGREQDRRCGVDARSRAELGVVRSGRSCRRACMQAAQSSRRAPGDEVAHAIDLGVVLRASERGGVLLDGDDPLHRSVRAKAIELPPAPANISTSVVLSGEQSSGRSMAILLATGSR